MFDYDGFKKESEIIGSILKNAPSFDKELRIGYDEYMMDMAVRGIGNNWNDIVIPGLDYLVVERTMGKYGNEAMVLNELPESVQHFVGRNF